MTAVSAGLADGERVLTEAVEASPSPIWRGTPSRRSARRSSSWPRACDVWPNCSTRSVRRDSPTLSRPGANVLFA